MSTVNRAVEPTGNQVPVGGVREKEIAYSSSEDDIEFDFDWSNGAQQQTAVGSPVIGGEQQVKITRRMSTENVWENKRRVPDPPEDDEVKLISNSYPPRKPGSSDMLDSKMDKILQVSSNCCHF